MGSTPIMPSMVVWNRARDFHPGSYRERKHIQSTQRSHGRPLNDNNGCNVATKPGFRPYRRSKSGGNGGEFRADPVYVKRDGYLLAYRGSM